MNRSLLIKPRLFLALTAIICCAANSNVHGQQQPRFTRILADGSISWTAQSNVLYQLQRAAELGSGDWTDIGSPVAGGGTLLVRDTNQPGGQAFYRLVATNVPPCTNTSAAFCTAAPYLGAVAGELNQCTSGPTVSGCGNAWFRVTLREANGMQTIDLEIDIALDSSPGANYDLYLMNGCAGQPLRFSAQGPGIRDQVWYYVTDVDGVNSSRDFWIEVRHAAGPPVGSWTLRTSGGTGPCYQ
jgi:hypothetical protein